MKIGVNVGDENRLTYLGAQRYVNQIEMEIGGGFLANATSDADAFHEMQTHVMSTQSFVVVNIAILANVATHIGMHYTCVMYGLL